MNKKLLKSFAAAAMSVLAIACAKEQVGPGEGAMVEATFSVDVPGVIGTKAVGDGLTASKLYYQVFDAEGKAIDGLGVQSADLTGRKATVSFQLIKDQTYNFIFWAQTPEAGYYTIDATEGLKKISADYSTHKEANDENRDAFFAVEKSLKITGPVSKNIELKRPFAQVNIATVGSYKVGEKEKAIDFSEAKSSVKFVSIPTLFTPLETEQVSVNKTTNFATAEIPEGNVTVAGQSYKYMAMNYIFASEEGSVYDITATLKVGGKSYSVSVPNAPLKRNWRTNIVGDFLTSSAEFNVVVTPNFEENGDETIDLNNIKTETELNAALATYGAANISNDIQVTSYLSPKGNKTITIASGGSISPSPDMRKALSEVIYLSSGTLTLEGEGKIVGQSEGTSGYGSEAITVAGGTLNIKGNLKVEAGGGSVKADRAVYVRSGTANIYGGYFHTMDDVEGKPNPVIFLNPDWGKTANCNIYGGVFESAGNPEYIVNIENSGKARANIKIYGGTFVGFNPADNIAEGAHTNFVAEGYRAVETTHNGKQAWKVEAIPAVTTQEALNTAIATANSTVVLAEGTYKLPKETVTVDGNEKSVIAEGVTIIGNGEGTVLNTEAAEKGGDNNYNAKCLNNVTFKNLTINEGQGNYNGIKHSDNLKYENCVIVGQPFSYADHVVYEGCTFNQTSSGAYNIWTYGSANITFNNCVFNCVGKAVLLYNEGTMSKEVATFNNCKFIATTPVAGKAAIEIDSTFSEYEVHINGCTESGFDAGSVSGNSLWNKKKGDKKVEVFVDGSQVL